MTIKLTYKKDASFIEKTWDIALIGKGIDPRGQASIPFLRKNTSECIEINYLNNDFTIQIANNPFDIDYASEEFSFCKNKSIVIDSTTLGFAEMLYIFKFLKENQINNFDILYLEPQRYKKSNFFGNSNLLNSRVFDLSDKVSDYTALPGFSAAIISEDIDIINQEVVFLCGYESERVNRSIEEMSFSVNHCKVVFGIPPFKPGWEMDSIANHINILKERRFKPRNISFSSTTNPLSTYEYLKKTYETLNPETNLFIVPLSTKPMSIGACAFIIDNLESERVSVLYDHPIKTKERTEEIAHWYMYKIEF